MKFSNSQLANISHAYGAPGIDSGMRLGGEQPCARNSWHAATNLFAREIRFEDPMT